MLSLPETRIDYCKKCDGELFPDWDIHGPRIFCLQCGCEHNEDGSLVELTRPALGDINLQAADRNRGARFFGDNRGKGTRGRHNFKVKIKSRSW